jgi:hypothetical protein
MCAARAAATALLAVTSAPALDPPAAAFKSETPCLRLVIFQLTSRYRSVAPLMVPPSHHA